MPYLGDISYIEEDRHWITAKIRVDAKDTAVILAKELQDLPVSAINLGYLTGCMMLVSKVMWAMTEGILKMPEESDTETFHAYLELVALAERLTWMIVNGVEDVEANAGTQA